MALLNKDSAISGKAETAFDRAALAASPRVKPDGGSLPPMVSYAQNFEDVMLRRALQDVESGFYVDIGAADPDADSVTRWFYEQGWRGINVEPDPQYFGSLAERRPEDKNLQCVIGAVNTNILFNIADRGGWSTGSAERMAEITNLRGVATKPILAPAITLDQLLTLSCGRVIDFLKIDAEDMEDDILSNASFTAHRPRIIVVEATRLDSQIPSHNVWELKLINNRYEFAWFDGVNRFYVRHEDEWRLGFFKTPPCVFDNFFNVTIGARIGEVKARAARSEAEIAERYDAALSDANAKTTAANAHAEAVEGKLQQITAEFERQKAELEARIEKLSELNSDYQRIEGSLAQRDSDYRRIQERLIQMESSRRRLLERLAQRDSDYQRIEESLAQRDSDYQRIEESLAQRDSDYQRIEESLVERDSEIALLAAERDAAAAQTLHWFAAAIPEDQARLDCRRQYPVQGRLYRSRLGRWLAPGLKRRRRVLIAAARQARDRQNWGLAARYYREVLDLTPDRPALWVQYGHALKETGNLAVAEGAYRKSLSLNAGIADTYLQLGHALKLQGRNAEAADAYRRSSTLAPGSPDATRELRALDSPISKIDHALEEEPVS